MANPNWLPGQSGNPKGRPKKDRALTAILEAAGSKTVILGDGSHVTRKRLMADMLWRAVQEGEIVLPGGKKMIIAPNDWFDTVQFLYKHIDGPPVQGLDVTSGGEKIATSDPAEIAQKVAALMRLAEERKNADGSG
jgi:hypothetical protein